MIDHQSQYTALGSDWIGSHRKHWAACCMYRSLKYTCTGLECAYRLECLPLRLQIGVWRSHLRFAAVAWPMRTSLRGNQAATGNNRGLPSTCTFILSLQSAKRRVGAAVGPSMLLKGVCRWSGLASCPTAKGTQHLLDCTCIRIVSMPRRTKWCLPCIGRHRPVQEHKDTTYARRSCSPSRI